jgi:hypothetical protein
MLNYKELVTKLVASGRYPVLEECVILNLYYKSIPTDYSATNVTRFDLRYHDPVDQFVKCSHPFQLTYLVSRKDRTFDVHRCDVIDSTTFKLECKRIKINRFVVDAQLQSPTKSETFEEELYTLLTMLNFDVPKISSLFDFTFIESTRVLPQYVDLWVVNYTVRDIEIGTVGRDQSKWYGPPDDDDGLLPVRVVNGKLAPCTSRSTVLSLNDDRGGHIPYTTHLIPHRRALVQLAYNPLENPILTFEYR